LQPRFRTCSSAWSPGWDGADRNTFVEPFVVPSWEEHLRQHHERLTGIDRDYETQVTALADGESLHHFISVDVPRGGGSTDG